MEVQADKYHMLRLAASATLVLALTSVPVYADGFLTPYIAADFAGDSSNCAGLAAGCGAKRAAYGVSLGKTGKGAGFEEDISVAHDFFGVGSGAETSAFAAMSNILFMGGSGRVQSYFVLGGGLVRTAVTQNQATVNENVAAIDFGGGANVFFATHFGIRSDIRYLHTLQDVHVAQDTGKLGCWRVTAGLALRF